MPFTSKVQWRAFAAKMRSGEITVREFREWVRASPPYDELPERVKRAKRRERQVPRASHGD